MATDVVQENDTMGKPDRGNSPFEEVEEEVIMIKGGSLRRRVEWGAEEVWAGTGIEDPL